MKRVVLILCAVLLSSTAFAQQGWVRLNTGVSEPFYHCFVVNKDTVYVSTNSQLLRTRDGGASWEVLITDAITRGCIWFMDDTTGIYAPTTDTIYKTVDGGEHWRAVVTGQVQTVVQQLQFVGRDTGWMTPHGSIFQTADGGEHWVERHSYSFHFSFANSRIGYGNMMPCCDSLEKTTDGGATWRSFAPRPTVGTLFALSPDTLVGIVGSNVAKSTDSGHTWQNHSVGIEIATIIFAGDHVHGWAMWRAIVHTTDGGLSWELQRTPTSVGLFDAAAVDTAVAYVVGDSGVVLKTTDGGTSWVDVGPGWARGMNVQCYPAPARDEILVTYTLDTSDRIAISIVNAGGVTVRTAETNGIESAGTHNERLDLTGLPSGAYTIIVRGSHAAGSAKVTVVR